MAATTQSPFIRPPERSGAVPMLSALGLAVVGGMLGISIAMGELQSFFVVLSAIACAAVLVNFRVGAVLLILLAPIESSSVFPHGLLDVPGLNPINLLVASTLVSLVLRWKEIDLGRVLPKQLGFLYLVPILVAGLYGMPHVDKIPDVFIDRGVLHFTTATGYYLDMVVKPLMMVLAALIVAAAVAVSEKPERFITPIVASVWIIALLQIGFVIGSGASIGQLADPNARAFLSGTGLHANDLGRLYAVAYGLLLFTWAESASKVLKFALVATMGILVIALVLTFSRGAMLGFVVVNLLFLLWKFNAKTLALGLLVLTVAAFVLPGAFFDRMSLGFSGSGNANVVSAGRIDNIWLPLLPEVFRSPIWGNGIGSTMWSDALINGLMFQVTHPHNAYLEALLDIGFVGLALLVAYYVHVWKGFRSLGSNANLSPMMRGFYQGAAAGLICFAVTGFSGSSLLPRPEYIFLWLASGMMYGQLARKPAG
jgi:O-antigen ligase